MVFRPLRLLGLALAWTALAGAALASQPAPTLRGTSFLSPQIQTASEPPLYDIQTASEPALYDYGGQLVGRCADPQEMMQLVIYLWGADPQLIAALYYALADLPIPWQVVDLSQPATPAANVSLLGVR